MPKEDLCPVLIIQNKEDSSRQFPGYVSFKEDRIFISADLEFKENFSLFELRAASNSKKRPSLKLSTKDNRLFIIIEDDKSLKKIFKKTPDHIREVVRQILEEDKSSLRIYTHGILIICLLLISIWGGLEVVTEIGRRSILNMPPKWEVSFGNMAYKLMTDKKSELEDPLLEEMLKEVTAPLLAVVDQGSYQYNFHLINSPTVNAFSLPGGTIVIYTGLLQQVNSPEELAGILAHEISHVQLRHSITALGNKIGVSLFLVLLPGIFGDFNEELQELVPYLFELPFTRNQEEEADVNGLKLLIRANISPEGMLNFFQNLSKEENYESLVSLISTHPSSNDRLEKLKKLISESKPSEEKKLIFPVNWQDVQKKVGEHLANSPLQEGVNNF